MAVSQKKKQTEYNIWTMPAKEWQQSLKGLRVSSTKLESLKKSGAVGKYTGERISSALQLSGSSQPTFAKLKKSFVY